MLILSKLEKDKVLCKPSNIFFLSNEHFLVLAKGYHKLERKFETEWLVTWFMSCGFVTLDVHYIIKVP